MSRATVSPPTAMQPEADGQATAVSVMGTYDVGEPRNVRPPSMLCATAPVPTAGKPTHVVPTMAHCVVRGTGHPVDVVDGRRPRVDGAQVCPPSVLRRSSPLAGTTSLTVVAGRAGGEADGGGETGRALEHAEPAGTDASAQVCPPSALTATAPCPWPLLVGT